MLLVAAVTASNGSAATTVYLSPSGSDAADCSLLAPCKSFARAYAVADTAACSTVEVTPGTYSDQFFAGGYLASQPAGSKCVAFHGQPGNSINRIHSGSNNITYDGINIDTHGRGEPKPFENGGGDNNAFVNGSCCNNTDTTGMLVDGANFRLENNRIHDNVETPQGEANGVHMECVYAIQVPNMVVRNNTFDNCSVMDLFFTYGNWWSPQPPAYGNVTVESNTFGASRFPNSVCCHYYSLVIGCTGPPCNSSEAGPLYGWRVRFNYVAPTSTATISEPRSQFSDNIFCGNTGNVDPSWATSCGTPPPPTPQCSDGIDNDGDGLIDYPADPGCTDALDNDETNGPLAPPPPKPQCSDGIDNDGDGRIDYPADHQCTSLSDNDERRRN
jgi:hypothetical protein